MLDNGNVWECLIMDQTIIICRQTSAAILIMHYAEQIHIWCSLDCTDTEYGVAYFKLYSDEAEADIIVLLVLHRILLLIAVPEWSFIWITCATLPA